MRLLILCVLLASCGKTQPQTKQASKVGTAKRGLTSELSVSNFSGNVGGDDKNNSNSNSNASENGIYNKIIAWTFSEESSLFEASNHQSNLYSLKCGIGQVVAFKNLEPKMKLGGVDAGSFHQSCRDNIFNLNCEFSRRSINVFKTLNLKFTLGSSEQSLKLSCDAAPDGGEEEEEEEEDDEEEDDDSEEEEEEEEE